MREQIPPEEAGPAARSWWNQAAAEYRGEHHTFLSQGLVWGPEGWTEADLKVLGTLAGLRILDLGCGQGQSTRWLLDQGAEVVGVDIAEVMLGYADASTLVCADAQALPFADNSFDLIVSAYGALPFIADLDAAFQEMHRLAPRIAFSTTHPIRWAFPDDPTALTAHHSYFDRTPYVERDALGKVAYSEHHRTIGDWVATLHNNGFAIDQLIELEWKADNKETWGGWSPQRGAVIPGTMLITAHRR